MADQETSQQDVTTSTETALESSENQEAGSDEGEGSEPVKTDSDASNEAKEAVAEIKRLKKLKIKFGGKEMEEDLPFEIPDDPKAIEYMQKQLQMAKLGTTSAERYSQLEKEVISFVEELRKNPRKALANPRIGVDVKKLAAEILEEEINNSSKTPEQLEKERMEAELREIKEEREREKEEFRQKELERMQEQEFQRYDMLMDKAFNDAKLPKNPYMVKRMADYLILGLQAGRKLDPADVLPLVQEEMMGDLKSMFETMPAESLKEFMGKDTLDKIRKHNVAQVKKAPVPVKAAVKDVGQKGEAKKDEKKQTFKDFFGI